MTHGFISQQTLRSLLNKRFSQKHRLERVVRGTRSASFRHQARKSTSDALVKLIQKQVLSGLAGIFGGSSMKNAGGGMLNPAEMFPRSSGNRQSSVFENAMQPFFHQQQGGFFDSRQMEFGIDQLVAASLMHGRQTSGVLRALFGLVPSLIGR